MTPYQANVCTALICSLEGVKLQSYQDSGGVWTIGVGHTRGVLPHQIITFQEALQFLKDDLQPIFLKLGTVPNLTTGQMMAYTSFGFNCGIGALGNVLSGKDQISNPVHHTDRHGNVLTGLQSRRNLELSLLEV